ncbi:hypothetical protein B296_00018883 [Ensete ventricosum]|uniref:Uncharacterized protein n=1 Tax=Ensete ventricosum TaxID=4639 RepID=A0A426Z7I2_ENSVE|nr:hypothetical protein B296_00018883 [Ensete ventricosum]
MVRRGRSDQCWSKRRTDEALRRGTGDRGVGNERGSRQEIETLEGDADSVMRAVMLERRVMKRRVRMWWTEEGKGNRKQWPRRKQLVTLWGCNSY